jgi:hypothetical protein
VLVPPSQPAPPAFEPIGLAFASPSRGYALWERSGARWMLTFTTSGGRRWRVVRHGEASSPYRVPRFAQQRGNQRAVKALCRINPALSFSSARHGGDQWVLCTLPPSAGSELKTLWHSTDGGRHWHRAATYVFFGYAAGLLAAPGGPLYEWSTYPGTLAVRPQHRAWRVTSLLRNGIDEIEGLSARGRWAVTVVCRRTRQTPDGRLAWYRTSDAGAHWHRIAVATPRWPPSR